MEIPDDIEPVILKLNRKAEALLRTMGFESAHLHDDVVENAKDVVAEVLRIVWEKESEEEIEDWYQFLRGVMFNHLRNERRKDISRKKGTHRSNAYWTDEDGVEHDLLETIADSGDSPEQILEENRKRSIANKIFKEELAKESTSFRAFVVLHAFEGLSVRDAFERCGETSVSFQAYHHRYKNVFMPSVQRRRLELEGGI